MVNMWVISGTLSMQISPSVERFFKKKFLGAKKLVIWDIISRRVEFGRKNLTGKLDDSFNMTSLREQNTVSNKHVPQIWLWMCSMASQDPEEILRHHTVSFFSIFSGNGFGNPLITGHQTSCLKSQSLYFLYLSWSKMLTVDAVSIPGCEGALWPTCHTLTLLRGPMNLLRSLQHLPNGTRLLFILL